jgi:hypothetical protein
MSKPLIYVDQNVLGLQLAGAINLARLTDVQWVYSTEHFAEIRRSTSPEKYLQALKDINAKRLELKLENWKITGEARLIDVINPNDHYAGYLEALGDVDFDEGLYDPLLVWINGGGNQELLKSVPQRFSAQLQALNSQLPAEFPPLQSEVSGSRFGEMLEQMIVQGNDILKTRAAFGGENGRFGSIVGQNQLQQIWEIVRPACTNVTSDQFFGFEPPSKLENNSLPLFLGIGCCCAILDIIGFQAEKKTRDIEKLPNVRSDAGHIGMGAYCTALLTADRRLAKRAKAIYEYKNIGTVALIMEVSGSRSTQADG